MTTTETTADVLRRLTKERNEARAEVERLNGFADEAEAAYQARDALAAQLARVEALAERTDALCVGPRPFLFLSDLRTALTDPAAERPNARPLRSSDTPANTEACAHCGEPAVGYARGGNGERLCHSDERSCYTVESPRAASRSSLRAALALVIATRDKGAVGDGR